MIIRFSLVHVVLWIIYVSVCYSQNDNDNSLSLVNMCGIVGENRPKKPEDCIQGELDFGGNCCFVKFMPKDVDVKEFTACITVKTFNEDSLAISHKVAEGMNYKLDIICNAYNIRLMYWSVVMFVWMLL